MGKWSPAHATRHLMPARSSVLSVLSILLFCSSALGKYVGSQACRSCHPHQFQEQSSSEHARALALAPSGSPGQWAFGAGVKAITYVSQSSTEWYVEHGSTYYSATKSMGFTPGHSN